ncbi:MAG: MFS transporter [Anaerolineae bacterium]|nr:MFS transporter [Anaerolineae bacterium]
MAATVTPAATPFVRTRSIWFAYALMSYFTLALSFLGPTMPFVGARLDLTFTQIGYHFTLMAAGVVFTSLIGDRIVRRIGYTRLFWLGVILILIGLPGLTLGGSLMITIPAMFLYGFGIGLVVQISNAIIAGAARQHSAIAFTEGNIAGGVALVIGPIVVGLLAKSTFGWQTVAVLPLIAMGLLLLIFRKLPLPAMPARENTTEISPPSTTLPRLFWIFGILFFLSVAIEWLISSWGTSFLTTVVGFELSTAAGLLSVFPVALVLGRLVGRRLLGFMPESRLMFLSLIWVLLAFPIYWLSTLPALNVAGLFLIGLGVGNLAPLSMSGAMTSACDATNQASARLGIFPSLSTITMVQLLGILADRYGIRNAYAIEIVVVIVAIAFALSTRRMRVVTA